MINIYYSLNSTSSKKAINWFKSIGINIYVKKIKQIEREDILHILYLSDNGFKGILKRGTSINSELMSFIEEMETRKAIEFIIEHTELLKVPIIFDEKKLMIGFHAEEIRKFIPKLHRKLYLEDFEDLK